MSDWKTNIFLYRQYDKECTYKYIYNYNYRLFDEKGAIRAMHT